MVEGQVIMLTAEPVAGQQQLVEVLLPTKDQEAVPVDGALQEREKPVHGVWNSTGEVNRAIEGHLNAEAVADGKYQIIFKAI